MKNLKNSKVILIALVIVVVIAILSFLFSLNEKEGLKIKPIFELELPITVLQVDDFDDGGTTCLFMQDRQKKELYLCLDKRLKPWSPEPEPEHFWLGYPESEDSEKIPYKGKEEKELLLILRSWDAVVDDYNIMKRSVNNIIEELEDRL